VRTTNKDAELILRRKCKKRTKKGEDIEQVLLLKLKKKKKKGKSKESDSSESEFTSVKVGMREHLKRLAMVESNRTDIQNSNVSPSYESNHDLEVSKSSKKLEDARSEARNAITERVNKRVKALFESKETGRTRKDSASSPEQSTLLKEPHSEKLTDPGKGIAFTLPEENEEDDMVYLQALEQVEKKLSTPHINQANAHTGTICWLSSNPSNSSPQGVTPSVMQELERLKKENDALRKSQQNLIQTQHQCYITSPDSSMTAQEPLAVVDDDIHEEEDEKCPIMAVDEISSPINSPPQTSEMSQPLIKTQEIEMSSSEEQHELSVLSQSNAVQESSDTCQNIIDSSIVGTTEDTTLLKIEKSKVMETNSKKEKAYECESISIPAQQIKPRLRVIDSSSSSSSSSSSDTSDDSSSDGETSSNTLEAALKAVRTSSQPKAAASSAKISKKELPPEKHQAIDKRLTQTNCSTQASTYKGGKNSPLNNRRASLTSQELPGQTTSKCKSSLLWPLLDSFYDFILNLEPNHVQIGERNKFLSRFSSLPNRYQR
jgi:hypothetical protein